MQGSGSEHATAVLAGPRAVLIRGPAGSGKSQLAWSLLKAAERGEIPFARLVADDRVALSVVNGRLIASAPKQIEGLIELRGAGIRRVPFEPFAVVGLVVDLAARDAERVPAETALQTALLGVTLPRVPVAEGSEALPLVLRILAESPGPR
ncbi:MAG: HPr kinase/phosphatase C-terminal domain-containing protein [Xanthobacteraceae bacterium]|nr:HPr kinase/phosphatase C-terminal domain-containing protein [Xanthobacteraceae bacterium]